MTGYCKVKDRGNPLIKRPIFFYTRRYFTYALCASLLGVGTLKLARHSHAAPAKQTAAGKANAATLLKDAKKSLAYMIKHAKADEGLSPKTAKNKPYWQAVQKIARQLDAADKGLKAKDKGFFKAVSEARMAEEAMKVAWPLTDSKNKEVIDGGRKLGHALALLRTNFSLEAQRVKKGGDLSDKEKAEMAKLKAEQKKQLALINKLMKKHANNKALVAGLKKMRGRCRHALKEPLTPAGYASLFYTVDIITGEFRSYEFYVEKEDRAEWTSAEHEYTETTESVETEEESIETADWAEESESIDIAEDEEVEDSAIDEEPDSDIAAEEESVEDANYDETPAEEEAEAEAEESDEQTAEEADGEDEGDSMEDASDDAGEDDDGADDGGSDEGGDD